jgi:hypothetical protein
MKRVFGSRFWWVLLLFLVGVGWLAFGLNWRLVWWMTGGLLGVGLSVVDRLLYVYWLQPQEHLSIHIQSLVKQKRFGDALVVLWYRQDEQKRLIGRGILFLVTWVPVTYYVMSSSGSVIATGMVMGLGLSLVWEMVSLWHKPSQLQQRFFWQLKRDFTLKEMRIGLGGFIALFGLFTLLLVL